MNKAWSLMAPFMPGTLTSGKAAEPVPTRLHLRPAICIGREPRNESTCCLGYVSICHLRKRLMKHGGGAFVRPR
ncbi:hypothetical protein BD311DRAFT_756466 [Dichomitus squalens]|uniref:Uncharacterized protein n=1 Tax=Dichomitus squalens TaxID=114155 RepID=A0A4Q9MSR0_9APHY|nr:hypothetical protein BD311DRAFT_756466 [Dichomitus squalens]